MKVLFVQLPLQDPNGESAQANIPLAAGYLSAYAESRGLLARGDWAILDYLDVVLHVFSEEARRFYDLERLWADAPRLEFPPPEPPPAAGATED